MTVSVDHAVINVLYRMDEAQERFRQLGFTLTERGYHSLGSINHLMMFGRDYLELVGVPEGSPRVRREIADSPLGLNGLVFATDDARGLYRQLRDKGVPVTAPVDFDRPVTIDGVERRAAFTTVRLDANYLQAGRVYFCEHKTRDLVWRPEWQQHANGATGLESFTIVVPEPGCEVDKYQRFLGIEPRRHSAEECELTVGRVRILFLTLKLYRERYGDFGTDPQGRATFMGALGIRTASMKQARDSVTNIPGRRMLRHDGEHIVVAASSGFNTALTFLS